MPLQIERHHEGSARAMADDVNILEFGTVESRVMLRIYHKGHKFCDGYCRMTTAVSTARPRVVARGDSAGRRGHRFQGAADRAPRRLPRLTDGAEEGPSARRLTRGESPHQRYVMRPHNVFAVYGR